MTDFNNETPKNFHEKLYEQIDLDYKNNSFKKEGNYGFAICGTPIKQEKGIIIGINWKSENEDSYNQQTPANRSIAAAAGRCLQHRP